MVEFEELGKEKWNRDKVYKTEHIWYWDEEGGIWRNFTASRTEIFLTKVMRKMIEQVRGDL